MDRKIHCGDPLSSGRAQPVSRYWRFHSSEESGAWDQKAGSQLAAGLARPPRRSPPPAARRKRKRNLTQPPEKSEPPRIPARKSSAMRQRSVPIGLDGRSILLVCGVGLCWVGLCCWLDPELPSKTLRSCLDQSDRGWPSFIRIKQKNLTSKSFIKFWHWNQKKFKMQKRK